eukprot:11623575-Karenia_brevis.AAC.1
MISFSAAISTCAQQGQRLWCLNVISFSAAIMQQVVLWQCGHLGIRVGEAAHPGPGETSSAAAT